MLSTVLDPLVAMALGVIAVAAALTLVAGPVIALVPSLRRRPWVRTAGIVCGCFVACCGTTAGASLTAAQDRPTVVAALVFALVGAVTAAGLVAYGRRASREA